MRRLRGSFDCQRLATVARHTSPTTRPALSASYPDASLGATSCASLKRHGALPSTLAPCLWSSTSAPHGSACVWSLEGRLGPPVASVVLRPCQPAVSWLEPPFYAIVPSDVAGDLTKTILVRHKHCTFIMVHLNMSKYKQQCLAHQQQMLFQISSPRFALPSETTKAAGSSATFRRLQVHLWPIPEPQQDCSMRFHRFCPQWNDSMHASTKNICLVKCYLTAPNASPNARQIKVWKGAKLFQLLLTTPVGTSNLILLSAHYYLRPMCKRNNKKHADLIIQWKSQRLYLHKHVPMLGPQEATLSSATKAHIPGHNVILQQGSDKLQILHFHGRLRHTRCSPRQPDDLRVFPELLRVQTACNCQCRR